LWQFQDCMNHSLVPVYPLAIHWLVISQQMEDEKIYWWREEFQEWWLGLIWIIDQQGGNKRIPRCTHWTPLILLEFNLFSTEWIVSTNFNRVLQNKRCCNTILINYQIFLGIYGANIVFLYFLETSTFCKKIGHDANPLIFQLEYYQRRYFVLWHSIRIYCVIFEFLKKIAHSILLDYWVKYIIILNIGHNKINN